MKDKYLLKMAEHLKLSLVRYIRTTPEKETVVIDHDPITGSLSIWVEGRYKVTIEDLYRLKGKAS